MPPRARHAALLGACLAFSGCGGGGSGAPAPPAAAPPPPPPPAVVFAPAPSAWRVSGTAGFAPNCEGVAPAGDTLWAEAEVEPHVAVHPLDPQRLVGAWQQNRWAGGSAQGLLAAYSTDGGATWSGSSAPFSRCTGGNAGNGGDYQRATDPWVAIAPDGTAYFMALATTGASFSAGSVNAMLVARSTDGGRSWSNPVTLIQDGAAAFNDKNTLTADPLSAQHVYAVWDRIGASRGPTMFARTSNGGASWEAARVIHDPGANNQTIGNLIVVVPAGAQAGVLVNLFTEITAQPNGTTTAALRVQRSGDRGVNWSAPVTVAQMQAIGARDPQNNTAIRDGSGLAQMAAAPNGDLYVVWQDARFSGGQVDAIVFARSTDAGLTWSAPQRLSPAQPAAAFSPQVAVRADGTVAVLYFDLRSDTIDPTTLGSEAWLALSADQGATWREQRISGPFDVATAPVARGYFLGDYHGLVASGSALVPFFVQPTGAGAANRTDVYATRIVPTMNQTVRRAVADIAVAADADFAARIAANIERQLAWRRQDRQRLR